MTRLIRLPILLLLVFLAITLFSHFRIFVQDAKYSDDLPALIARANAPAPLTRWRALAALQWHREPAAVDAMLAALKDPDSLVKKTAIRALGWYGDKRAIEKLIPLLADPNRDISSTAAEALEHFRDPAITEALIVRQAKYYKYDASKLEIKKKGLSEVDALLLIAKENDPGLRDWAIGWLGNIKEKDPRILPLLISALYDSDQTVRERAGTALAYQNDPRALEALIGAYKAEKDGDKKRSFLVNLSRKQDPRVLQIMLEQMRYGQSQVPEWYLRECGPEVVDTLIGALRDKEMSAKGKDTIAAALLRIGDHHAIPALAAALNGIHYQPDDPWQEDWGGGVYDALIGFGPRVRDAVFAQAKKTKNPGAHSACLRILAIFKDPRAAQPLLKDLNDKELHPEAFESLRLLGDKRLKPALITLTHSKGAELRRQAWISLGRMGYKPALPKLLAYMERSSPEIWGHLSEVEALGELRDARAVPALLKMLKDEDEGTGTRAAACKALGKIGDLRALEPLRQMPNGESEESFNPAAEAIASILKRSSVFILTQYLKDSDARYRSAALQALKSNGSEAALDIFLAHYKNAEAAERLSIINGLYGIDNPRIKEALKDSLNDPEPRVRFYAVSRLINEYGARDIAPLLVPPISEPNIDQEMEWLLRDALVKCKDPRTAEPLLKLLNETNVSAQTIAADGLGAIKEQRAVPRLIELAEPVPGKGPDKYRGHRPEVYLRAAALQALGEIGDGRAVPVLLAALREDPPGDCEPSLGKVAALVLGKCRDKRAIEPLILSLQDPLVSGAAAEALGIIGDQRAIEPLKKLQTDEMPNISILGALAKLGDRDALDELFVIAKKNDRYYNSDAAAVHALGAVNDARVVPALIAALARSSACDAAAQELAIRKEPRAIPALIAELRKNNHSYFVVEALRDITGQSFGGNPDKWSAWWKGQARRVKIK